MGLTRCAGRMARTAALWGACATIALALVLTALGFLIAGLYLWLAQAVGPAAGAAITGGALLLLAALTGLSGALLLRRPRQPEPSPLADLAMVATGLALEGLLTARRKPKKEA